MRSQPRWGWEFCVAVTQGSSGVVTLGWEAQRRWRRGRGEGTGAVNSQSPIANSRGKEGRAQRRWGWEFCVAVTQGSSGVATLGFGAQRRWRRGRGEGTVAVNSR